MYRGKTVLVIRSYMLLAVMFHYAADQRRSLLSYLASVVFDTTRGVVSLGRIGRGNQFGLLFTPYDTARRPLAAGKPCAVRILARDEFVEVYEDDELLFSLSEPGDRHAGRLGMAALGTVEFSRSRVAPVRPL